MLRAFGHPVATCCDMLGVVGSNLKMVKFFMQHLKLWMLHDVVVVWPGLCNNFAPRHAHKFDFQLATCRNTLQQGDQTRATCCAQQCCNLLRLNVAIIWPELANAGPTLLGYVALRCCYRLAGALLNSRKATWNIFVNLMPPHPCISLTSSLALWKGFVCNSATFGNPL